jgi:hypothetical protein
MTTEHEALVEVLKVLKDLPDLSARRVLKRAESVYALRSQLSTGPHLRLVEDE